MSDAPFELIHASGCKRPAVLMVRIPVEGERKSALMFRHLDGRAVTALDPVICDDCKGPLREGDFLIENVRARAEEQTDRTVTGGLRESGPEYTGIAG